MAAFYISGRDAKFDVFEGVSADACCPKCGCLLDPNYLPHQIDRAVKVKFDMFSSSEGVEFVSDRLREFLKDLPDVEIVQIRSANTMLNVLRSKRLVRFDVSRRPVAFGNRCDLCGQFKDVYRALPIYLIPGEVIETRGLYMTDLFSGHGRMKRRKLIAGPGLADEIRANGFTGLSFDPVAV